MVVNPWRIYVSLGLNDLIHMIFHQQLQLGWQEQTALSVHEVNVATKRQLESDLTWYAIS